MQQFCGITIGNYALIGAGSVIIENVPDFALLVGNPGRQVGWVDKKGQRLNFDKKGRSKCGDFFYDGKKVILVDNH